MSPKHHWVPLCEWMCVFVLHLPATSEMEHVALIHIQLLLRSQHLIITIDINWNDCQYSSLYLSKTSTIVYCLTLRGWQINFLVHPFSFNSNKSSIWIFGKHPSQIWWIYIITYRRTKLFSCYCILHKPYEDCHLFHHFRFCNEQMKVDLDLEA